MIREFIRNSLIELGLYYSYLDQKFYRLDNNQAQREFYKNIIRADALVFDIGANRGQRSKIFSDIGAKVVAFEPQSYCISHLKSRFRRNEKVKIREIALGSSKRIETMYTSDFDTISTLSKNHRDQFARKVFKEAKWDKTIKVPISTLDHEISIHGKPDFVKIDVEGYEYEVIKGLSEPIKCISFEFTPMERVFEPTINSIQYLTRLSSKYRFNYSLGEDLEFELDSNISGEELLRMKSFRNASNFGDVYAILEE